MRCFIAFSISPDVKKALVETHEALREANPSALVTYTKPETWHLTAVFLGEITTDLVTQITQILDNLVKNYQPFKFQLDAVDAFPNKFRPNVLVVRVNDETGEAHSTNSGQARKFQSELVKELQRLRLEIENKLWKPHLTLGRNKNNDKIIGLDEIKVESIKWKVESVELIKSELRPEGPRYVVLKSFSLQ